MKITISRSFSKKVQVKQFEPIDAFCAAQIEFDNDGEIEGLLKDGGKEQVSRELDEFCRAEVQKTLDDITQKKCARCGGITRYKSSDEHYCPACTKDLGSQAKDFRESNAKNKKGTPESGIETKVA